MPKRQLAPRSCSCGDPVCSTCFPGPPSAAFGKVQHVIGGPEVKAPKSLSAPWTTAWGRKSMEARKVSLLDLPVHCYRTCFALKPETEARSRCNSYDILEESNLVGSIGVISLPLEAPLKEVREALGRKFKKELPLKFRFLHPEHGALDAGAEVGELSFRYKDLVWKESSGPPHVALMLPGYVEGEQLPEPESRTREYKSLASAVWNRPCSAKKLAANEKPARCSHPECLAKNALTALSGFLSKGYIGSFLNSGGGVLVLGIEDADRRVRLKIDDTTGYVGFTDKDLDDLVRVVDSSVGNIDPVVDDDLIRIRFVQVFPPLEQSCAAPVDSASELNTRKPYVIEVHVAPGRRRIYFESRNSMVAFVRKEGSKHQLDPTSALSRLREDARQNPLSVQEGWRGLYVEPDIFANMVRNVRKAWRLHKDQRCDDFVGRDAIFKRLSQALEGHRGVVLMGGGGTGKTAILQQIICATPATTRNMTPPPLALGYNFASSDREYSTRPYFVLQNLLGFLLSDRFVHDLDLVGNEVKGVLNSNKSLAEQLHASAIHDNWEAVLSGPFATALKWAKPPDSKKSRLVLCFDGLSVPPQGGPEPEVGQLEEFVVSAVQSLPEWLGFIVSVPGPYLPKSFDPGIWKIIHLDGQGEEAQDLVEDMQCFASLQLSSSKTTAAPNMTATAANGKGKVEMPLDESDLLELCRRANGSYVWLKTALDCLRQEALSLRQLLEMPSGLSEEFFQKLFSSRFKQGSSMWQDLQPLLALLCAGGELTLQQLAQIRWSLLPDVPPPEPLCQHLERILRAAGGILHFEAAESLSATEPELPCERLQSSSSLTLPLEPAARTRTTPPPPTSMTSTTSRKVSPVEPPALASAESAPHCRLVDSVARWLTQGMADQDFALNMEWAHSQLAAHLLRKATLGPQNLLIEASLNLSTSAVAASLRSSLRSLARAKSEGPAVVSSNVVGARVEGSTDHHPVALLLCVEDTYRLAAHLSSAGLSLERADMLWRDTLESGTGFVPTDGALRLAARRGKEGAAALLLKVGASPCAGAEPTFGCDGAAQDAVTLASAAAAAAAAAATTEPAASPPAGDPCSWRNATTALAVAARKGHSAVLELLLQHVLPWESACLETALSLARQQKHELCSEMLESTLRKLSDDEPT